MTPATMTGPRRIQWRARRKGWRKPPNTVLVGRGTRWGNPFRVFEGDRERAVAEFRAWLAGEIPEPDHTAPPTMAQIRQHLAGKDLGCWCPLDQPCHADVLLELAKRAAAATRLKGEP